MARSETAEGIWKWVQTPFFLAAKQPLCM